TGCKNSCVDKSDCATADFDCKDGKCVPQATARCADDGIHIQEGDSVTADCSPGRCKGGKCVETCVDSALDCIPGYVCGTDGKCAPQPTEEPKTGCGCTTQPAPFSSAAAIAVLAIAASLGRRARRRP
ncbi:MAG: MYXO-CTERM sorting domain-containing protein, partial [Polyangiales bacterium]